jgi:hypothetical protein
MKFTQVGFFNRLDLILHKVVKAIDVFLSFGGMLKVHAALH